MTNLAIKQDFYDYSVESPSADLEVSQQTIDDYLAFFTKSAGADMLPYVYMESSVPYNSLIKDCTDYYIYNDEIEIIKKKEKAFVSYLDNVTNIIEVGPGSHSAVTNKTLPILGYAKNLKNYYAVDHSKHYLDEACNLIQAKRNDLKLFCMEANLLEFNKLKLNLAQDNKKNAILFLGSTLGNFNQPQQEFILKQFNNLLNTDDLFILTIDNNQDEESLLKAYSNSYSNNFVMGALNHYAKINSDFKELLPFFEVNTVLDKALNSICMYFRVKKDLSFFFKGYGNITLYKGQQLKEITSYKSSSDQITELLLNNKFEVLDILDNSGKVKIFICKRV